jgi:hypothetical protein
LLGTIQIHREDTSDTPEEFQHRFAVGMCLDIVTTTEIAPESNLDELAESKYRKIKISLRVVGKAISLVDGTRCMYGKREFSSRRVQSSVGDEFIGFSNEQMLNLYSRQFRRGRLKLKSTLFS